MKSRKIIHIDMDCFYAAIEIRDNPSLKDKPIAVGGSALERSVLCTCNYLARAYGIHSGMPTSQAQRLCRDLIVLPVQMDKYKAVSQRIQAIFHQYSDRVEPLALDEAYLDVSESTQCQGSATWMAEAIRRQINEEEQLTASAGVSTNKLLAKIASGWNKPNGLFVVLPEEIDPFMKRLSVKKLQGVGRVTFEKLNALGVKTCQDLQYFSRDDLRKHFGKRGDSLYEQCRGVDDRAVENDRPRKSLSVEHTFAKDIFSQEDAKSQIEILYRRLMVRLKRMEESPKLKNQFIKIKFSDFTQMTAEQKVSAMSLHTFTHLFESLLAKSEKPIRLIGVGLHFQVKEILEPEQYSLF